MIRKFLYVILFLLTLLTWQRETVGAIEHEYLGIAFGIFFLIHMRGKSFKRIFSLTPRGFFNLILILSFLVTLAMGLATATTAVHIVNLRGASLIYSIEVHEFGGYLTSILIAIHLIDKSKFLRNLFFKTSN